MMTFLSGIGELWDIFKNFKLDDRFSVHYWIVYFLIKYFVANDDDGEDSPSLANDLPLHNADGVNTNDTRQSAQRKQRRRAMRSSRRALSKQSKSRMSDSNTCSSTDTSATGSAATGTISSHVARVSSHIQHAREAFDSSVSPPDALSTLAATVAGVAPSDGTEAAGDTKDEVNNQSLQLSLAAMVLFSFAIFDLFIDRFVAGNEYVSYSSGSPSSSSSSSTLDSSGSSSVASSGDTSSSSTPGEAEALSRWKQSALLCLFVGSQMFLFLMLEQLRCALVNTKYRISSDKIEFARMLVRSFLIVGSVLGCLVFLVTVEPDNEAIFRLIKVVMFGGTVTFCKIYVLSIVTIFISTFKQIAADLRIEYGREWDYSKRTGLNARGPENGMEGDDNDGEFPFNRFMDPTLLASIATRIIKSRSEADYAALGLGLGTHDNDMDANDEKNDILSVENELLSKDLTISQLYPELQKINVTFEMSQSLQFRIIMLNKIGKYCVISLVVALNMSMLWLTIALLIFYDINWLENGNRLPFMHFSMFALVNVICIVMYAEFSDHLYIKWCSKPHTWFAMHTIAYPDGWSPYY